MGVLGWAGLVRTAALLAGLLACLLAESAGPGPDGGGEEDTRPVAHSVQRTLPVLAGVFWRRRSLHTTSWPLAERAEGGTDARMTGGGGREAQGSGQAVCRWWRVVVRGRGCCRSNRVVVWTTKNAADRREEDEEDSLPLSSRRSAQK